MTRRLNRFVYPTQKGGERKLEAYGVCSNGSRACADGVARLDATQQPKQKIGAAKAVVTGKSRCYRARVQARRIGNAKASGLRKGKHSA